ncbi:MAG: septum formation initiator family protein [Alphaproteobacteria bacterium]|nr:septum formation initiator family protein [Alphaproteobacteria bacterium]
MYLIRRLRSRARDLAIPVLGLGVLVYIAYHAVNGDRGLLAWWQLSDQMDRTRAQLARTSAEVMRMEHRVGLMRPEKLDRDMLDERIRSILLLAHPRDLIIESKP